MYIQPTGRKAPEMPFSVPRDYSGNAFRSPPEEEFTPPPPAEIAVPPPPELAFEETEATASSPEEGEGAPLSEEVASEAAEPPAIPTGGGFFSRIPFLSSLLPPPRKHGKEKGGLPDWVLIAALIFLFGGEGDEDDILPFLLLLLLWN